MTRKRDRRSDEACPKCKAEPDQHCRNYKGQRKQPCRIEESRLRKNGERLYQQLAELPFEPEDAEGA